MRFLHLTKHGAPVVHAWASLQGRPSIDVFAQAVLLCICFSAMLVDDRVLSPCTPNFCPVMLADAAQARTQPVSGQFTTSATTKPKNNGNQRYCIAHVCAAWRTTQTFVIFRIEYDKCQWSPSHSIVYHLSKHCARQSALFVCASTTWYGLDRAHVGGSRGHAV